jgi:hypothetical protein
MIATSPNGTRRREAKLLQIFEAVGLEDPWVAAQRASCRCCCSADRNRTPRDRHSPSIFPLAARSCFPGCTAAAHFEPR